MRRLSQGKYLITLIILAFGMTVVEIFSGIKGELVSDKTYGLWSFVFILLTAMWVNEDANRNDFDKPFELGFLIYILWPVTLPWYLVSTRGVEGLIMVSGFAALYIGPWVAGVLVFYYYG